MKTSITPIEIAFFFSKVHRALNLRVSRQLELELN